MTVIVITFVSPDAAQRAFSARMGGGTGHRFPSSVRIRMELQTQQPSRASECFADFGCEPGLVGKITERGM